MVSRFFWGALALLALSLPSLSQAQCPGQQTAMVWMADELKTVSSTATGLTAGVYKSGGVTASMAVIQVQQAPVVYRNGANPTASVGGPLPLGSSFPICGLDSIQVFKAIRQTATDSVLFVNYYRTK